MHKLTIEELRSTQLSILDEVARYCADHGIRFFLYFGTLLGAVRHQGYIPWDDDVDIAMPRRDYERFCGMAAEPSAVGGYSVYSSRTHSDFPWPFAKVGDDNTVWREQSDLTFPIGVNIDVFPLDGWPEAKMAVNVHRAVIQCYEWILDAKHIRTGSGRAQYKDRLLAIAKYLTQLVPVNTVVSRISTSASHYPAESSKFVGVLVWAYREIASREAIGSTIMLQFEDRVYPVPIGYDEILRATYGDYMRLPPVEKRITHHAFEAFRLE